MRILAAVATLVATLSSIVGASDLLAGLYDISTIPECELNCVFGLLNTTNCPITDASCFCSDTAFISSIQTCAVASCTVKELLLGQRNFGKFCTPSLKDRSHIIVPVVASGTAIATLFVIMRVIARVAMKRFWYEPDNYTMLINWGFVIATGIAFLKCGENGLGVEIWNIDFDNIYKLFMWFWIAEILYMFTIMLTKLSLLFFFLQIFPGRRVRIALWAVVGLVIALEVAFIPVVILQCRPISYFWTRWDGEHSGSCMNDSIIPWSTAVIGIVIDIIMLVIPLSQVAAMNLHWKKKIGVAIMFSVGAFLAVVSILRMQTLNEFMATPNSTYDTLPVGMWSYAETVVGLMCTCLPACAGLIRHLFPKWTANARSHFARSRGGKHNSDGATEPPSSRCGSANSGLQKVLDHKDIEMCSVIHESEKEDDIETGSYRPDTAGSTTLTNNTSQEARARRPTSEDASSAELMESFELSRKEDIV